MLVGCSYIAETVQENDEYKRLSEKNEQCI